MAGHWAVLSAARWAALSAAMMAVLTAVTKVDHWAAKRVATMVLVLPLPCGTLERRAAAARILEPLASVSSR
ncbi:hypothetical protein B484DRAFT_460291 [Ochromonadaceae sp. CCMP2298]|nr:hypothetical protein B484DRAFT_460291 [Ochromonadaceae sp. CCMP2298]